MNSNIGMLALLLLAVAACGPKTGGQRGVSLARGQVEGSSAEQAGRDESVARQLLLASQGQWERLHLLCECRGEREWRSVEVFGRGVGIWRGQRQFELDRDLLLELLAALRDADFAGMREVYGGKEDPLVPRFAQRVTCRVTLDLDGLTKAVVQLDEGRQSPELKAVAERILDLTDGPGRAGTGADSLSDGLGKIASGALAPEALRIVVNRKREGRGMASGQQGWLLRIREGELSVARFSGQGYGEPRVEPLAPQQLHGVAQVLIDQRVGELPINLYADHYTDLVVEVLNWSKRLQARAFARMTPQTHGEKQRQFDRIFEEFDRLASLALDGS